MNPMLSSALGNFFGDGNVFVKIPWQPLQLTNPLKSLNVSVSRAGIVAHQLERTNVASLEIKRTQAVASRSPHAKTRTKQGYLRADTLRPYSIAFIFTTVVFLDSILCGLVLSLKIFTEHKSGR